MKLHRWQTECLEIWEKNGYRGIVQAVTGAGKTVLAFCAVKKLLAAFPELRIRIVVPTIPLAHQWEKAFLQELGTEDFWPGFYGGGVHDDPDRRVLIYVVNSAREFFGKHAKRDLALGRQLFLICDECHHYTSPENRKIFSFLTEEVRKNGQVFTLGLSATPFGTGDDGVLYRNLGPLIYEYGLQRAVSEGVIAPFVICETSTSFLAEEGKEYAELSERVTGLMARVLSAYKELKGLPSAEFLKRLAAIAKKADMDPSEPAAALLLLLYRRKEISDLARSRIQCAVSLLRTLRKEERVIVFCERIEQAEECLSSIRRVFGSGAASVYHSGMTKESRNRVLSEFRDRRFRILVSCRCLDEGIDVPDAGVGIVLSSTSVPRQRIQRLGRVIRRASGKEAACLYYISVRGSMEDSAYFQETEDYERFPLRYYPEEDVFSSGLYEYAGSEILKSMNEKHVSRESLLELRRCISEGITRPDYLLSAEFQDAHIRRAETVHERNYWKTMKKIGLSFKEDEDGKL